MNPKDPFFYRDVLLVSRRLSSGRVERLAGDQRGDQTGDQETGWIKQEEKPLPGLVTSSILLCWPFTTKD